MHELLHEYLVQNKRLSLPGIGNFRLERIPARADFVNRAFLPGFYAAVFDRTRDTPSKRFFVWLGSMMKVSELEAIRLVNDLSFDIRRQLLSGEDYQLAGIGTLRHALGNEIRFEPATIDVTYNDTVFAEKVIREHAHHRMMVGERETTSDEMSQYLNGQPGYEEKKSKWWLFAGGAGLVAIVVLGWYFSQHGFKVSATGSQQKIKQTPASQHYKTIQ